MKKKVAILGYSKSMDDAPFSDKSWEIWSCNEGDVERFDRTFEMHPMSVQNERELKWLSECTQPVYVLEKTPLVPSGVVYPLKDILKQWWADEYFCCSFAYEIALAIYENFQVIGLWGMNADQGSPRERTVESACIQHWMALAKGMGIEVVWPDHPKDVRLKYGYDYGAEKWLIENWLSHLAVQTIYRVGPTHASIGGDYEPIRLPEGKK